MTAAERPPAPPLKICLYGSKHDNEPEIHELPDFAALAHELGWETGSHAFRLDKDGLLFSPGEILEGHLRANKNTLRIHFGVLDLDDISDEELQEVQNRLEGLSSVVYTTWTHGKARTHGRHRYRVVLGLSRPVRADEWADFWPRMVTRFGSSRDEACKDPSRMYYVPAMPVGDEALAVYRYAPGELLDVDDVLRDPDPGIPMGKRARLKTPVSAANHRRPASEKAKKWAQGRLERHAETVRAAPHPGPIYPILNRAAFMAGQLCPHLLELEDAADALFDAATTRNPDPSKVGRYAEVIEKGLEEGTSDPWWPEPRYPMTDTGNAERIADRYGAKIRHVQGWQKWLAWDGFRWVLEGGDVHVAQLVKESIRSIKEEAARIEDLEPRKKLFAWSIASESAGRRAAAEKLAAAEPGIAISHVALDASPWLFNAANGTLDLRTGELLDHDPGDLITKRSPVPYNADADCPTWDRFLDECMGGDPELVRYLQKAVGYSLTGSVREHVLFFLHGSGANGKTTFVNTLLDLLADYGAVGAPDLLLAKAGAAHPTEQTDLAGARLVSCQEVEQGRTWAEATVKQLTGGDPIKARRMREDFWTFLPTHKFWISGNSKPNVRGSDEGIWRRIRLIPFEVSFLGREDRDLKLKLERELEGILAWAVRGCALWLREGLQNPRAVQEATQAYRDEQDTIGLFLAEKCDTSDPAARVTRAQLRMAYEAWCREQGERNPFSPRALAGALRERGFREVSVQAPGKSYPERGWAGLALRPGGAAGLVRAVS